MHLVMTNFLDLNTSDEQSPLILLQQCRHLRRELVGRVQENFERFSSTVLPLFVDGTRLFRRASERKWDHEHLDFTIQEVRDLEVLCRQVEQLFRCYQEILTASSNSDADTNRTDLARTSRPSDQG